MGLLSGVQRRQLRGSSRPISWQLGCFTQVHLRQVLEACSEKPRVKDMTRRRTRQSIVSMTWRFSHTMRTVRVRERLDWPAYFLQCQKSTRWMSVAACDVHFWVYSRTVLPLIGGSTAVLHAYKLELMISCCRLSTTGVSDSTGDWCGYRQVTGALRCHWGCDSATLSGIHVHTGALASEQPDAARTVMTRQLRPFSRSIVL